MSFHFRKGSVPSPLGSRRKSHLHLTAYITTTRRTAPLTQGHVRVHQSHAPPFSQGLPSGLARSQQLYMMQRFLNIPATPSYVDKDGGLVLDRVVANIGGNTWWHTLTLRLRAQRAWNTQQFSEGKPHQVLGDPSMYALGGRFRAGFSRSTVFKAFGELGSLKGLVERFKTLSNNNNNNNNGEGGAAGGDLDEKPRGRVTLQSKLLPWHVFQADVSLRERYQTADGYVDGPSHASLSLASRGPQFLNYRFGVRQWLDETLPAFERATTPEGGALLRPPPRREATAGVSLEQQMVLWRGERRPAASGRRPGGYAALPQKPCVTVGGLIGAVARLPLVDSDGWVRGEFEGRHVASASLHANIGSFSRPILDYTALDLRYHVGATQPYRPLSDPKPAGEMSAIERAVNFNGRVQVESEVVHLAATQQLLGPLRLRAEVRCTPQAVGAATKSAWRELSSTTTTTGGGAGGGAVQGAGAGGKLGSAWTAVKGEMAGCELIYGVDCPIPPALGAARLVAWYNVNRGEAMAEMRLFDL